LTTLAAACSSAAVRSGTGVAHLTGIAQAAPPGATTSTLPPPTTPTTAPEQPGWTAVSYWGLLIAVDDRSITAPDGHSVTVARFHYLRTRFDLHDGSQDPPTGTASLPADTGPSLSSNETPLLLAAFNGGFMVKSGSGGFEVDGQTLVPLANGVASFAIDADGTGHVGVWGQDLPAPGEQVESVRQNLSPLVRSAQPSPLISNIGAWGATLGGGATVARSALGEDAQGDILYAGSMAALPVDLADALIACGATSAMELDINPAWIELALAPAAGGPLSAGVPGQNRPATQYLSGWTRDFVAVLALTGD
jgi:hypothetical protein